jgi:hypothetical protein
MRAIRSSRRILYFFYPDLPIFALFDAIGYSRGKRGSHPNSEKKRMFHFIAIKSSGDTLCVELRMFRPDLKGFEKIPQLTFIREGPAKPGN